MNVEWNDDWAIGNELIDSQHKELFKALNNFVDACYAGKRVNVIESTMNFLLEYTVKHFADEEALQLSIGYPDYEQHKKLHGIFKTKAIELAEQLRANGPTNMLIMRINSTVGEWLTIHIDKEDGKIGGYLKNNSE